MDIMGLDIEPGSHRDPGVVGSGQQAGTRVRSCGTNILDYRRQP
jgi:hypothetical protein